MFKSTPVIFVVVSLAASAVTSAANRFEKKCIDEKVEEDERSFFYTYEIKERGCTIICYWLLTGEDDRFFETSFSHNIPVNIGRSCGGNNRCNSEGQCIPQDDPVSDKFSFKFYKLIAPPKIVMPDLPEQQKVLQLSDLSASSTFQIGPFKLEDKVGFITKNVVEYTCEESCEFTVKIVDSHDQNDESALFSIDAREFYRIHRNDTVSVYSHEPIKGFKLRFSVDLID